MFYFLVFIAAVTSSISLFEAIVTWRIDAGREKGKKVNRTSTMCVAAVLSLIVGLPVALDAIGGGVTGVAGAIPAPYTFFGMSIDQLTAGEIPMFIDSWLDFFDVISEGILMPLGALVMALLIGWKWKTKDLIVPECEASGHKFWGYGFFNYLLQVRHPDRHGHSPYRPDHRLLRISGRIVQRRYGHICEILTAPVLKTGAVFTPHLPAVSLGTRAGWAAGCRRV